MLKNPHFRFLLRALGSLAVALALWFLLLMDPLLGGLRIATALALRLLPGDGAVAQVSIGQEGDWLLRMPVPASIGRLDSVQQIFGRVSKDAPLVKVRSLKLTIEGRYPMLFTVSLPFFWALWAAAPAGGKFLRGLLAGTGLLAILGILSLVFFAVYTSVQELHLRPAGLTGFLLGLGRFAVTEALPYAAPPILAVWLNEGLRGLVFSSAEALPEPAALEPKAARASRGRYRG